MAPSPHFNASSSQPYTTNRSSQNDFFISIFFGLCAVLGSLITIWQGHRALKAWHQRSSPSNEGVEEDSSSAYEMDTRIPPRPRNNETLDDAASASPSFDTNATLTDERNTSREPSRAPNGPASIAENTMVGNGDGSCVAAIPHRNRSPEQQSEDLEQNTQADSPM